MKLPKIRAVLEWVNALVAGSLGIITIFWRDSVEALTHEDRDEDSGG